MCGRFVTVRCTCTTLVVAVVVCCDVVAGCACSLTRLQSNSRRAAPLVLPPKGAAVLFWGATTFTIISINSLVVVHTHTHC